MSDEQHTSWVATTRMYSAHCETCGVLQYTGYDEAAAQKAARNHQEVWHDDAR